MIDEAIGRLAQYGLDTGLIEEEDRIYVINQILEVLGLDAYEGPSGDAGGAGGEEAREEAPDRGRQLEEILKELLDYAAERGLLRGNTVTWRDLFDTKLMNCLTPRPSQVAGTFWQRYASSPEEATDYFYGLSQDSDYIRRYRVRRDMKWKVRGRYGDLDVTVNLSKPEKDPRAIAAARRAAPGGYPRCLLCMENVGYAGRADHPARNNLRVIPLTLGGSRWGLQYSPYVYYNEHCIVFNGRHVPMKIGRDTFVRLLEFVQMFPHYFLGSNADLPIVGGSILSHDHFQGGRYSFAMAKAPVEERYRASGYEDVEAGIVRWPMSVIRLRAEDPGRLTDLADRVLGIWRDYTDEEAFIFARTGGEPHNTVTPIARRAGGRFELDLVLRSNLTTEEYPLGVYHPHPELHHIKKENIGLIEVMGLAVLPARLKDELALLGEYIVEGRDIASNAAIAGHADWAARFLPKYGKVTADSVGGILRREVGLVFERVLEDAGVYKATREGRKAFGRFMARAGFARA